MLVGVGSGVEISEQYGSNMGIFKFQITLKCLEIVRFARATHHSNQVIRVWIPLWTPSLWTFSTRKNNKRRFCTSNFHHLEQFHHLEHLLSSNQHLQKKSNHALRNVMFEVMHLEKLEFHHLQHHFELHFALQTFSLALGTLKFCTLNILHFKHFCTLKWV